MRNPELTFYWKVTELRPEQENNFALMRYIMIIIYTIVGSYHIFANRKVFYAYFYTTQLLVFVFRHSSLFLVTEVPQI
jgi:hypothetical protein